MPDVLLTATVQGRGFTPVLESAAFDQWEAVVGSTLGEHRSRLLGGSAQRFRTRLASVTAGSLHLLHINGQGSIELDRAQGDQGGVLWLPCQGWSEERINGQVLQAEPGQALLIRPGDELLGRTSRRLEGISIQIPAQHLQSGLPALIGFGSQDQALLAAAWQLVQVAAAGTRGGALAAAAFLDALQEWQSHWHDRLRGQRERITAVRRRQSIAVAQQWMHQHLGEAFEIAHVAAAVGVSVRTLQYACLHEFGLTPMALAKRIRLRGLRQALLNPELASRSIADLMQGQGLLACDTTAADYRRYCGETPRETRQGLPTADS